MHKQKDNGNLKGMTLLYRMRKEHEEKCRLRKLVATRPEVAVFDLQSRAETIERLRANESKMQEELKSHRTKVDALRQRLYRYKLKLSDAQKASHEALVGHEASVKSLTTQRDSYRQKHAAVERRLGVLERTRASAARRRTPPPAADM